MRSPARVRVLLAVAAAAFLVYLNSLPNGFALDDDGILRHNEVVTEGMLDRAVTGPWWQLEPDWGHLYRPVTLTSFTLEWPVWNGSPLGFHAVNVAVHVGVTLLVTLLLLRLVPPWPALFGGLFFAVHPVHVEAVANVVGRAELYATAAFLAGCFAFLWRPSSTPGRVARLLAVGVCYALALGSKEIGVTLPGALLLLLAYGVRSGEVPTPRTLIRRVRDDGPLFVLLAAVLSAYLGARFLALGSVVGEGMSPELAGTTGVQRFLTALTLWPEYGRLMLLPLSLAADYGPPLLEAARGVTPMVVVGGAVLGAVLVLAATLRRSDPAAGLGLAWFFVTVLPVAHLGIHAGVLLAERTLYLPSVGAAITVSAVAATLADRVSSTTTRRAPALAALAAVAFLLLLAGRTVTRNPVWDSTFTLMRAQARDHPLSHRAFRYHAEILSNSGHTDAAGRAFDAALELYPQRFEIVVEAAGFHQEAGDLGRAEALARRAIGMDARRRAGYRILSATLLRAERGREAHRAAVAGLAAAGPDPVLWAHLSESYLLRRDFDAALRARRAALAAEARWAPAPGTPVPGTVPVEGTGEEELSGEAAHWGRIADILEMMDRPAREVEDARRRAASPGSGTGS